MSTSRIFPIVAAIGDLAVFVLFAVLGTRSHRETAGPLRIAAVSAPFAVGWLVMAVRENVFREALPSTYGVTAARVLRSWLPGFVLAIVLRSAAEKRLAPFGFVVVALAFTTGSLLLWRESLTAASRFAQKRWGI